MRLPFSLCVIRSRYFLFVFVFVRVRRLVIEIVEPRIGLWSWDDAGNVRIDVGVARTSFVAALLGFLAPHDLGLLLFRACPLALAFAST